MATMALETILEKTLRPIPSWGLGKTSKPASSFWDTLQDCILKGDIAVGFICMEHACRKSLVLDAIKHSVLPDMVVYRL